MPEPAPRQPASLGSSTEPASSSRRRLLVALGFGATNLAVLRSLSPGGASASGLVDLTNSANLPPPLPDAGPEPGLETVFDVVLQGGRVIDPESGFDTVADVGISGSLVGSIGTDLRGKETLDVSGLVVAPGFIDILSAEPDPFGVWFKVGDGVTTNLAMHGVNNYATAFFHRFEGTTPVHFGGAWHQHFIRGEDAAVGAVRPEQALSADQISELASLTEINLANGLAGVCFSPEYSPGTSTAEMLAVSKVAAARGHVLFFHVRHSDPEAPGTSLEAIDEAIALGRETGAPVHIEHLSSTGGTFVMGEALARIEAARTEGLDVTADMYPYDFWATTVASYRFAGDWRARYRIDYGDLQVAGQTRRLTEETFPDARRENLLVAAVGSIPEAEVQMGLAAPWMMIGSDAILTESLNNHPRATGTFSRVLGHYSRDLGLLSLQDALAKMTILPARRVEGMIPAMRAKGRLRRGADADITVFDPKTIIDKATIESPSVMSDGIVHVFVDGLRVLADGTPQREVLPGRVLRSA